LRLLIRPSLPVLHFTVRPNADRSCSVCLSFAGLPWRGMTTMRTLDASRRAEVYLYDTKRTIVSPPPAWRWSLRS
jgi:hypothetical protein